MPSRLLESIKKAIVGEELPTEARSTPAEKAPEKKAKKSNKKAPKKARKTAPKKAAATPAKKKAAKSTKQTTATPAKKKGTAAAKPVKKTVKKAAKSTKKAPKKPLVDWSSRELESLRTPDPRQQDWDPNRSKIKAAVENGMPLSYLSVQRMLYIGAAHGYTISHIAHRPLEIYALEKSPEMMRHFLPLAEDLPSVLPILGDAAYPESYAHYMPDRMDLLFQDIAQRDQVGIFIGNCERFLSRHGVGMLCMKALAVDSTAEPSAVFAETRERLEAEGFTIAQEVSLEPYQKGHRLFVVHQNPYDDF